MTSRRTHTRGAAPGLRWRPRPPPAILRPCVTLSYPYPNPRPYVRPRSAHSSFRELEAGGGGWEGVGGPLKHRAGGSGLQGQDSFWGHAGQPYIQVG